MKFRLWEKIVLGILMSIAGIAIFFVTAVCLNFLKNNFMWSNLTFGKVFKDKQFWLIVLVLEVAMLASCAICFWKVNARRREILRDNQGEDSHLLTLKEMKKSKDFTVTKFSELEKMKDSVVLKAEKFRKKDDIEIVFSKAPIHTQVIGITGTGKTTGFFNPTIQVLIHTKTKPSMIISDIKGELYDTHSQAMLEQGYKVLVIDLKEPYKSIKWNPFHILITRIDKIIDLSMLDANENGVFTYENKEYQKEQLQIYSQELRDEVYENARELTTALCPIHSSMDPKWQEGARDLINAIVLAFCEDYEYGVIDKKQFCFANLYNIVINYAVGDCENLIKYLIDIRSETSKVKGLASSVLSGESTTLSSYLTNLKDYVIWLADQAILSLTSENEIDFSRFDEEPSVLFIKIADEKEMRHKLVSVLITQLYKELVYKSTQNKNNGKTKEYELLRNCYFLLDEFGNFPVIPKLDVIITVARSRKIFFTLVVQSFVQLENKYGKNIAEIVKSNCPIKIFLGTDNKASLDEMVALSGKKKVINVSMNEHNEKTGNFNTTTSVAELPLVTVTDLKNLNSKDNFGNAFISFLGHFPFLSKYTPSFLVNEIYGIKMNTQKNDRVGTVFNEIDHYFDLEEYFAMLESFKAETSKIVENKKDKNFLSEEEYKKLQSKELEKLNAQVIEKIKKIKELISEEDYRKLTSADISSKISVLNEIIEDFDIKNKSELFEIMELKMSLKKLIISIKEKEEINFESK